MAWSFRATLFRPEGVGTWTLVPLPASVTREAGFRVRLRVKGTIDGAPFASSILSAGGSELYVVVPAPLRAKMGKAAGDSVRVALEADAAPVRVKVPADLRAALRADPEAEERFETLAPSHRKQYVEWVEHAVRPETRRRRISSTVDGARKRRPLK